MKPTGHYWCDNPKCDEIAFGPTCQRCRQPARFIPDPAPPSLPPAPPLVSQERGLQLFAELRRKHATL